MVTIKYYEDPLKRESTVYQCENISTWVCENFTDKSEILDLRYFKTDLLGQEIDTSDVSFLDLSEGVICVTHDSKIPQGPLAPFIPYLIVALVVAVATVLLVPKPTVPTISDRDETSSTNSNALGSITNEPRLNQRIDDLFGFVKDHIPPLWQVPYRIGVDNQEVEVLLLCIGRGKYDYDEDALRDSTTKIEDIPNSGISIYAPGTYPGNGAPETEVGVSIDEEIGIYTEPNDLNVTELDPPNDLSIGDAIWSFNYVSATQGQLILTNAGDLDVDLTDLINTNTSFVITDTFAWDQIGTITVYENDDQTGPVNYTVYDSVSLNGIYQVDAVQSNYVILSEGNIGNWSGLSGYIPIVDYWNVQNAGEQIPGIFIYTVLDGAIDQQVYYNATGGVISAFENTLDSQIGQILNGLVGPFTVKEGATEILLNFSSFNGFYDIVESNPVSVTISIEVLIEETDINGDITGNSSTYLQTHRSNTDNLKSTVFQSHRITIPPSYAYSRVSCRRVTDRIKADNRTNADNVSWQNLYYFEPIDSGHDFGDVTLAHVLMVSNSKSQLIKQREINGDFTRKITEYQGNGVFGPTESYPATRFDQILIHTALDPYIGRLSLSEINADGFLDVYTEIVNYFGSSDMTVFGYDFDNSQVTFQDTFAMIADVVNCLPYVQNGVYDIFFEKLQTSSSLQITHRNKIPGSESRKTTFRQKYDGVELTYRDRETGADNTIYIPEDQSAVNPDRQELAGCTTELQAYRRAYRERQKQIYKIHDVTFDVDEFGRLIVPGQRIDSPDGTRFTKREGVEDGYQIYDGEVVEVDGLNIELSQPVEFTDGEDHYIQFTNADGDTSEVILCTETDDQFIVTLQSIPSESIYDGYERDRTKFVLCSEQLRESLPLIPQTIEFSLDNGEEVNTIASINYSDRYYDGDTETP